MSKQKKITQQSVSQIQAHIRATASNSINIFFTDHVRKRMRMRKISDACILATLRQGTIKRTPEPNTMHGTLECRMEHYCTGNDIAVVVAISDDDPTLVLVTAMYN